MSGVYSCDVDSLRVDVVSFNYDDWGSSFNRNWMAGLTAEYQNYFHLQSHCQKQP